MEIVAAICRGMDLLVFIKRSAPATILVRHIPAEDNAYYYNKDLFFLKMAFCSPRPGLDITTQSPLLSVVTSAPTEVTTPTPSPPPTAGSGGLVAYTPI